MNVSPKYTDGDWKTAFEEVENWDLAIDIVEDRIEGRWLKWVDKIAKFQFSGFAVLALDCIVLESLWGFRNGRAVPYRGEEDVYREMLSTKQFEWPAKQIDDFRKFVRNGLIHDAETRNHWLVEMTVPKTSIAESNPAGGYMINRSKFHKAVRDTFRDWVDLLRSGDASLRARMRERMNDIIAKHYKP